jgi:hypothetical protein
MKGSREFRGYFKITSSREFDDFIRLDNSREIEEFEELNRYIRSSEFKAVKNTKFKDSEAWKKYLEHKRLKNTPEIKDYFKIKHSSEYKALKELEGSMKLSHFEELHQMVNSAEFIIMKKNMNAAEFRNTPEHDKYKEYLALKSGSDIRAYQKIQADKAYANFSMMENSKELDHYLNLEKFVNSLISGMPGKISNWSKATELIKQRIIKPLIIPSRFKSYYRIKNSKNLKYFLQLRNSPELERYLELDKYIGSDEFKETKAWMESRDKFKKSPSTSN